ncbi:hypothetical protein NDU88_002881 [Pleurodeles waltl]|uniref:Uncharacterized protein n=1 Tax=Pleurodeles waltl TaxID=8319 RepID=A0AAV7UAI8_PLEWA|nr:hypothetical protein NDU88_002881 [Pleurodeles waltl]
MSLFSLWRSYFALALLVAEALAWETSGRAPLSSRALRGSSNGVGSSGTVVAEVAGAVGQPVGAVNDGEENEAKDEEWNEANVNKITGGSISDEAWVLEVSEGKVFKEVKKYMSNGWLRKGLSFDGGDAGQDGRSGSVDSACCLGVDVSGATELYDDEQDGADACVEVDWCSQV